MPQKVCVTESQMPGEPSSHPPAVVAEIPAPPSAPRPAAASLSIWSYPQRRALVAMLVLVLVGLAVLLALNPSTIEDPQPARGRLADDLADKVDPNTADAATLAVIPTLGEKRAKAIVEYRDRRTALSPGTIVFRSPGDLERVSGIGPATADNIAPYLSFPPPAMTRP